MTCTGGRFCSEMFLASLYFRYIDLIHQRGQALFNAYNDLRKRLGDIRREISIIGRKNHDAEQTIKRLRVELDDWRTKTSKMQEELTKVQAEYKEMERKVKLKQQYVKWNLDVLCMKNVRLKRVEKWARAWLRPRRGWQRSSRPSLWSLMTCWQTTSSKF